jgi:hypothetical protein
LSRLSKSGRNGALDVPQSGRQLRIELMRQSRISGGQLVIQACQEAARASLCAARRHPDVSGSGPTIECGAGRRPWNGRPPDRCAARRPQGQRQEQGAARWTTTQARRPAAQQRTWTGRDRAAGWPRRPARWSRPSRPRRPPVPARTARWLWSWTRWPRSGRDWAAGWPTRRTRATGPAEAVRTTGPRWSSVPARTARWFWSWARWSRSGRDWAARWAGPTRRTRAAGSAQAIRPAGPRRSPDPARTARWLWSWARWSGSGRDWAAGWTRSTRPAQTVWQAWRRAGTRASPARRCGAARPARSAGHAQSIGQQRSRHWSARWTSHRSARRGSAGSAGRREDRGGALASGKDH